MIISIWNEVCKKMADKPAEEIYEYINSIYPEMFQPLLRISEFHSVQKNVLFYLLYAYSYDSDMVIHGAAWAHNAKDIAEKVGIPDYLYEDIVHIKNDTFRKVMVSYLGSQSERDFAHLQMNKDLYEAVSRELMKDLYTPDSEGKLDLKDLIDKGKLKDDLLVRITAGELALREKYEYVIYNKGEAEKIDKKRAKKSLAIEQSDELRD